MAHCRDDLHIIYIKIPMKHWCQGELVLYTTTVSYPPLCSDDLYPLLLAILGRDAGFIDSQTEISRNEKFEFQFLS